MAPRDRRPWNHVVVATRQQAACGPAVDPIQFDPPRLKRGRRSDVWRYNRETGQIDVARKVLFRDYSNSDDANDRKNSLFRHVTEAYCPLPGKRTKTIMGHLSICMVLERYGSDDDDDDDDDEEAATSVLAVIADRDDGPTSSLGKHNNNVVFRCTDRKVAVKVNYRDRMVQYHGKHAEDPMKEIAAMQLINDGRSHPNVLGFLDVLEDDNTINIVLPYCDSGDFFSLLYEDNPLRASAATRGGLPEAVARFWFRQIVAGVQYLHHTAGVCHRDLSPENIMIDKGKRAVIIDFGMCVRVPYTNDITDDDDAAYDSGRQQRRRRLLMLPQGQCGKKRYMSPEIYRNQSAFDGEAIDVWTCGVILFCMITGAPSYEISHDSDPQFHWMTHGLQYLLEDWTVHISHDCLDLLQNVLSVNPRQRLSLQEVLDHPWLALPDEVPTEATRTATRAAT